MIEACDLYIPEIDRDKVSRLAKEFNCSELLAHLLINRGVVSKDEVEAYFRASYDDLYDPKSYPGVSEAVKMIAKTISKGEKIFICGDYDVDGIAATAILVLGLRRLHAQVGCHLPHRFNEGFGLSKLGVDLAKEYGASLLITVDCGSSSAENVEYARKSGLKVIITDHHQVEENCAKPDAFVNANLSGHNYPFCKLCGAGVAWKLLSAIFETFSLEAPNDFLDLVALATLCDMVPMKGENRTLTMLGLPILARLERPSLRVLAKFCKVNPESINSQTIGFSLGPKLNACGRMETPQTALDMLLTHDEQACIVKAEHLLELSQERHDVELSTLQEIEGLLSKQDLSNKKCIFICGDWHQGVIGLCAQRLMDTYLKPCFVATNREGNIVGSARTPQGVDLLQIMNLCSDCLSKYGGHYNAGGFTIIEGRVQEFAESLERACSLIDIPKPKKKIDCILPISALNTYLVRELERLEPTGEENDKPLFLARGVRVQ
ncbi:single-stranded-DNA-specific exonuclease RecJ, partial [bacterium]|nr:single-stranded-DNA-specific exonuclease RecJ [bacterium]